MRAVAALLILLLCSLAPADAAKGKLVYHQRLRFVRDHGEFHLLVVDDQAAQLRLALSSDGQSIDLSGPGLDHLSLPASVPPSVESVDRQVIDGKSGVTVRFKAPMRIAAQRVVPADAKFHARLIATLARTGAATPAVAAAAPPAASANPPAAPTAAAAPAPSPTVPAPVPNASAPVVAMTAPAAPAPAAPAPAAPAPAPATPTVAPPAASPTPVVASAPPKPVVTPKARSAGGEPTLLGVRSLLLDRPRADVDSAISRDFGADAPVVRIAAQEGGKVRNLYTVRTAIGLYGQARLVYDFSAIDDRLDAVLIDWGVGEAALDHQTAGALAFRLLGRLREEGIPMRANVEPQATDKLVDEAWDAFLTDGSLVVLALRRSPAGDGYEVRFTLGK